MSKKIVVKVNQWFTLDLDNLGGASVVRRAMHVDECDPLTDEDIKWFVSDKISVCDFIDEFDHDSIEYDNVEVING
jgi:hypothetical protein